MTRKYERIRIYFDQQDNHLVIEDCTDLESDLLPIRIAKDTLSELKLEGSCTLIGQRIVALNPALRELFRGQFPGDIEDAEHSVEPQPPPA